MEILHQDYYNSNSIETIKVIRDWKLGFSLGNVVKYISRLGKKDKKKIIEDLNKAINYLNFAIEEFSENQEKSSQYEYIRKYDPKQLKESWDLSENTYKAIDYIYSFSSPFSNDAHKMRCLFEAREFLEKEKEKLSI